MKKLKVLLLIILTITLVGCNKYNGYTQLYYNDLESKLDNKESFVLVVGSETCSACQKYKETMKNIIKENKVNIFYIDLHSLSEEDYAKVYSEFVVSSTPTTIFIVDGKEKTTYDRITGAAEQKEIEASLKKYGYIGE